MKKILLTLLLVLGLAFYCACEVNIEIPTNNDTPSIIEEPTKDPTDDPGNTDTPSADTKALKTLLSTSYEISEQGRAKDNVEYNTALTSSYNSFAFATTRYLLNSLSNETANKTTNEFVYSPASFYMALSLETEGSDNNTYKELMNFLKADTIENLRAKNQELYKLNTYKNDNGLAKAANSIWTFNGLTAKQDYINTLKENYFVDVYQGDTTANYLSDIAKWINTNTFDFLNVKENDLKDFEEDSLILINTLYFKNNWAEHYNKEDSFVDDWNVTNSNGIAVKPEQATYMTHTVNTKFYLGKEYTYVQDNFENGNKMHFFMPNDGYELSDCLCEQALSIINDEMKMSMGQVNLTIPKFKLQNSLDLIPCAKSLGVNDLFDGNADLSKMADATLYVANIKQIVGIEVNEKGAEAAASTIIGNRETSIGGEITKITINKPFVYAITDSNNNIIFIGTCLHPVTTDPTVID